MKKFNTLNVVTTAMLTALAVILARTFHHLAGGALGSLFSPMHFPILVAGLLCGPYLGPIGGLAAYGFFAGLLRSVFIKNNKVNKFASVIALAISMVIGRLINALVGAVLMTATAGTPFFVNLWTKFIGNFTSTWLAIILQLVLIPALLFALKKGGILVKYIDDNSQPQSDEVKGEQPVQQH